MAKHPKIVLTKSDGTKTIMPFCSHEIAEIRLNGMLSVLEFLGYKVYHKDIIEDEYQYYHFMNCTIEYFS